MRHRKCVLVLLTLAAVAAWPAAASAVLPQQQGAVDLLSQANVQLDGADVGNQAGSSVASAGDVNGDGHADVVVGAPLAFNGRAQSGAAHVVFGQPGWTSGAALDLAAAGTRGFTIVGANPFDRVGTAVARAGDVNGDGLGDLLVGAPEADPNNTMNGGAAYVVFGKAGSAAIDLAALGEDGFRIDGAAIEDGAGHSVAGAGDVNGDGRADVVIGAPFVDSASASSGAAYVVFGKAGGARVDLGTLGAGGFRIAGDAGGDQAGFSVAGPGDVNRDGRPDVIVGANGANAPSGGDAGSAYVVFGKSTTSNVLLATLGASGFRIIGAAGGDFAGTSVGGAGDVNADGRSDLIVGAPLADPGGRFSAGTAAVVFGRDATTSVDLGALDAGGFRIDGAVAGDQLGTAVAGAGDVNGDGRSDVVAGSRYATASSRATSGSATVAFGKLDSLPVQAGALAASGYRIDGAAADDEAGRSVAGAGDFNADGRPDVLVGAFGADNSNRINSGAAYLVFGFGPPALAYAPILAQLNQPIAPLAPTFARTGVPGFSAPALPAGLTIHPTTGVISGAPTVAAPTTSIAVTMTDLAGTATALLPITVAAPATTPPAAAPPPPPPPCIDCDGDGYPAAVDCNDANRTINPGARDIPGNAVDEDCSGTRAPYPRLDSSIYTLFRYFRRHTIVTEISIRTARKGSTIRLSCIGPRCPFRVKRRTVAKDVRRLNVTVYVKGKRLRPGARLEIRVTKPRTVGVVRRLAIRADKAPKQTDLCLRPGATRPARCPL